MTNNRTFFAWALLLPVLLTYLGEMTAADGSAYDFLFRYLWLAGVPYLMLVLALLIWMEGKNDYAIKVGIQRALLTLVPILALLDFMALEWLTIEAHMPWREKIFGVLVFSACLLIVGYLYAMVVEFIYFVAKEAEH